MSEVKLKYYCVSQQRFKLEDGVAGTTLTDNKYHDVFKNLSLNDIYTIVNICNLYKEHLLKGLSNE